MTELLVEEVPQLPFGKLSLLDRVRRPGSTRYPAYGNVPAPGVGVELSFKIPAGVVWELCALHFRFNTSGAAANRLPVLTIGDDTVNAVVLPSQLNYTSGNHPDFTYLRTGGMASNAGSLGNYYVLPNVPLLGGWIIQTTTTALQVGDSYDRISFYAIEHRPPDPAALLAT